MIWPFTRTPKPTASDAGRALAKQGHQQRRARKIEVMNILRDEMDMPRFEGRPGL